MSMTPEEIDKIYIQERLKSVTCKQTLRKRK